MKKAIGKIHLWLGLGSGLIVFIISITGCIYVFEEELKGIVYTDRKLITVPDHGVKKPLSFLLPLAQAELGEQYPIQAIEIPTAANQTYTFRPTQIRNNKAYTHFGEIVYYRKLYVNPYTGEIVKNENTKYEFFTLVLRLHRNLLLNRSVGKMIIGISVLFFVILLISGIVLWWPKNKKSIKQRLSFVWKKTTTWKRKNYDLHNVPGFYSLFFVLIIALTGLMWSFDWFDNGVQWIANGGVKTEKSKPVFSDTTRMSAMLPIDKIHRDLLALNPDAYSLSLNLPEKPEGVINATARKGVHIRYNTLRYQFDQFTGRIIKTNRFEEKDGGEKLKAMNYDIHTGAILGFPGKVFAFIASLISASLPVTGFILWYGRRNKKTVKKKIAVTKSAPKHTALKRRSVLKSPAFVREIENNTSDVLQN